MYLSARSSILRAKHLWGLVREFWSRSLDSEFIPYGDMEPCALSSGTPHPDEYGSRANGCRCSRGARISETCISCLHAKSSVFFPSRLLSQRKSTLSTLLSIQHCQAFFKYLLHTLQEFIQRTIPRKKSWHALMGDHPPRPHQRQHTF